MKDFLRNGPEDARVTVLLAHGAGAPMDSVGMTMAAEALASEGLAVARFEFALQQLRTAHLVDVKAPTLIVQGTRDPFGTEAEVPGYALSSAIELFWLPDGDHDLKPRKRISGFSHVDHMARMAAAVADWVERVT